MLAGTVVIEKNAGSSFGAATARRRPRRARATSAARTGIDMKGGTIIVGGRTGAFSRLHDAARPHGDPAATPARTSAIRCTTASSTSAARSQSLGVDAVDGGDDRLSTSPGSRASSRMYGLEAAARHREHDQDRRRQAALELRQSRAGREEARALRRGHAVGRPDRVPPLGHPSKVAPQEGPAQQPTFSGAELHLFTPEVIDDIHIKAELGRYRMRGMAIFKKIPSWDDLTFLPGTLTRFVIEGYREKCETRTVLGPRAKRPLVLDIPIYITGMSFGALSYEAKVALARGATMAGTATCSGEGGMIPDERRYSEQVVLPVHPVALRLQPAPSAPGGRLRDLHRPGLQGRASAATSWARRSPIRWPRCARCRPASTSARRLAIPTGSVRTTSRSRSRRSREATNWRDPDPAQARRGAGVRRRAHGGQDRPGHHLHRRHGRLDRRRARTSRPRKPAFPALPPSARRARRWTTSGKTGEISLVYAGGIRNGADVAKALALGADAVAIGTAALMALNCNKDIPEADYERDDRRRGRLLLPLPYRPLPGRGRDAGSEAARRASIPTRRPSASTTSCTRSRMECQMMARACGKTNVHSPRARGPRGADHGGLGDGHGAARRHAAHGRPPGHDPVLSSKDDAR